MQVSTNTHIWSHCGFRTRTEDARLFCRAWPHSCQERKENAGH